MACSSFESVFASVG